MSFQGYLSDFEWKSMIRVQTCLWCQGGFFLYGLFMSLSKQKKKRKEEKREEKIQRKNNSEIEKEREKKTKRRQKTKA